MKRIGIDARLYFQTGVGVYIRNLLHYLHEMKPVDWEVYVYFSPKDMCEKDRYPHFIPRYTKAKWHSLEEQYIFPAELYKDKLDMMHFTYFSYPVLYRRPFVATVHDLTPLMYKTGRASTLPSPMYHFKHLLYRFVLKQQLTRSRYILTPTIAVKNEILQSYSRLSQQKIIALHEGLSYEFEKELPKKPAIKELEELNPFILYVGNFYPHKNVERLIEAFSQLDTTTRLILAGPQNYFSYMLQQKVAGLDIKNIVFYHPVSSAELLFLYRHTNGLVMPSLSEGFGLPLIEAASQGVPIAASDIAVFTELLGGQYIRFNPTNISDMCQALKSLIKQKGQRKTYSIPEDFSFKKMVQSYIKIIDR